jgi:hypothetical protein
VMNSWKREGMLGVFSVVTSTFNYMQDRIRDWISMPKANGMSTSPNCHGPKENGLKYRSAANE